MKSQNDVTRVGGNYFQNGQDNILNEMDDKRLLPQIITACFRWNVVGYFNKGEIQPYLTYPIINKG